MLAACASSPEERARKLHQTEKSWQATAWLVTDLRNQGAVPGEYVRQTLEAASQELEKARRNAGQPTQ
jgi:hypothetical protein